MFEAGRWRLVARGNLKLARISSKSQRLLDMMKLLLAFESHDTVESAVKSFAWKG